MPKQPSIKFNSRGFSTMEILVAVFLFSFVMVIVGASYMLAQRSYSKGAAENELAQNVRVSLDRLTREIRQSVGIITALPPVNNDPANPPVNELIIQDGHDMSRITYIRYYVSGASLYRRHFAYYFSEQPDVYVLNNSTDSFGNPPEEIFLADQVIGEYVSSLEFWGENGLVNINLELSKAGRTLNIDTSVYSRNE